MHQQQFRPPAVPLITHDPYFSIWSFGDKLTDDWTKHWTGKNQALCGMIRVDGTTYRWMSPGLRDVPAADQRKIEVGPTQTRYVFAAGSVELQAVFTSPMLILQMSSMYFPYCYVSLTVNSIDGKPHDVSVYLDVSAEIAVNSSDQSVGWSRHKIGDLQALSFAASDQRPLNKVGDDLRIDWGRFYLLPPPGETVIGDSESVRRGFASGKMPDRDSLNQPKSVESMWPVAAWASHVAQISATPVSYELILAYDDEFSIEYFQRALPPMWRGENRDLSQMLADANATANSSVKICGEWDKELTTEWKSKFGPEFSSLASLAFRQSVAGHQLVRDIDGTLLMFSKENFSNGCIGTVDVMYPACPLFLALEPALLKANMEPIMQYASMPRWKWKFAPHDLGTYPKANGQVYGGGEKTEENQMPVEESGNMLIMAAAYLDKSGDKAWITKYWGKFTEWAEYLEQFGVDPGTQLCTDDFAGHLAHNANLSVKAIVAMACYGRMAETLGHREVAAKWTKLAQSFVKDWMKMADDGDHYRLAFDKPGTWSQKYNLVWDKVLKLNLFPQEVYDKEVAYYLKKMNKYGLPLDNRADYTKLDWTVWTACLASKKEDFEAIMAPVYKWMNETPDRVPLTDWYDTKNAKCIGFRARTVVGGVFMPLLMK